MSNPIELMGEIERTSNESGDAKPGTVVMLYSQFQALLWSIEAQADELAQARARIAEVVLLKERNPMPEHTKDTYRSGFDVGYALALQHAADHLQDERIEREAKESG